MKKVLILALAFVLLLGIVAHGTFGLFSDTETSTGNTFTAWVQEVVCAKFNVSDDKGNIHKIFSYEVVADNLTLVGSFDLLSDNKNPTGVATVGDYVYVLDHSQHKVYKYTCSGTYEDVSKTLKKHSGSGLGKPDALVIFNDELWVVVWGANEYVIYGYSLTAAFTGPETTVNALYEILLHDDDREPTGMAVGNDYIFTIDKDDKQFYRYPYPGGIHDGDPVAISKVLKESIASGGGDLDSPAGAMFDGTSPNGTLWVVDSGTDKMYEYDMNDINGLFADDADSINANREFDLHPDNADATGV